MVITATEFKTNLGKYLDLVEEEDIVITKNSKVIARLTLPHSGEMASLRSLVGIASSPEEVDLDLLRTERLKRQ